MTVTATARSSCSAAAPGAAERPPSFFRPATRAKEALIAVAARQAHGPTTLGVRPSRDASALSGGGAWEAIHQHVICWRSGGKTPTAEPSAVGDVVLDVRSRCAALQHF